MTWLTLLNKGGPYLAVLAIVGGIAFGGKRLQRTPLPRHCKVIPR